MPSLQEELKQPGLDKILFMVPELYRTDSGILGVDGKPIYLDTSHHPYARKVNKGTVLLVPEHYSPAMEKYQKEVAVGDQIYFDYSALSDTRKLDEGIYYIYYPEIIAKVAKVMKINVSDVEESYGTPYYEHYKKAIVDYKLGLNPKGVAEEGEYFVIPLSTYTLLKPIYKNTVQEVDPEKQPGVMGEITASGIVANTDTHLKGSGEIGSYKLVHNDEAEPIWDEVPTGPEQLLLNELYERNVATVAHIGSNYKHQAPVAQVGDKVFVPLFDRMGMPNVPAIEILGQEYYYTRQDQIQAIFKN